MNPRPKNVAIVLSFLAMALFAAGFAPAFIPAVAVAQSTTNVTIQNFAFSPSTITLVIGVNNTVTWTNNDSTTHTVTADDGSFDSGNLAPGSSFTHTFTTAGTFAYHCSIHSTMTGTVKVEAAASTSTSSSSSTSFTSTPSSTSSSTHPSTSTTSSTSASSTSFTTTSSSSSSEGGGGIPEFPYQAVAVTAITLLVLASYFLVRQTKSGRTGSIMARF